MYQSRRPLRPAQPPQRGSITVPAPRRLRRIVVVVTGLILLFLTAAAVIALGQKDTTVKTKTAPNNSASTATSTSVQFDRQQHSLTDASSIWVIVNKKRPLNPKTFVPANLVVPNVPLRTNISNDEKRLQADAAQALESLVNAAKTQGITFNLQSGYRSYNFQATLYNSYVKQQGQSTADRQSARPGFSEHQTGLALDLGGTTDPACNVEACFADTPEGKWLAANAHQYGFIIRYPADKESTTGYIYEPWHVRYIGVDLAAEMQAKNIDTLENFFALGAAPTY
jgi:zinc D-Ala-D-Ala carboxypeptidase